MKKTWVRLSALIVAVALLAPASLLAQPGEKGDKGDKGVKEKKEVRQFIITNKSGKDDKIVVEIVGDKVTVNGKPVEEYKDGDVTVRSTKVRDYDALTNLYNATGGAWSFDEKNGRSMLRTDANHAMLGVTTEETEGGVLVNDITKESAAEKIGLKEGDIITKIDDKKIASPDELSKAIREHKPGDKVAVTYLRDKKEQKATGELTKWKGVSALTVPGYKMDMGDMNFEQVMPRVQGVPRVGSPFGGQNWSWSGGAPKLGLSVQDTDDGKGVKVIEVDSESNAAKAGVKNDDVITEVDGKAVNSTDDMVKMIKESKEKTSIMVKLLRGGKTQNIEVKMPKKIKTADL
ncbi:hypothetical protein CAP36_17420 [Chitinophagaceae bacterium IBVUCB2]|nr:hypothetical protein CAP36_17420 [Chitinophagaceae bacterium IBVUCB2]